MPCPPFGCTNCAHPACDDGGFVHLQASPHPCTEMDCPCESYGYPPGVEVSEYEGGGGSGGGGGASGGW